MAKSPLDDLYRTARWRRIRTAQIKKVPCCERCQSLGIVRPAVIVDHHPPHNNDVTRFWSGPFRSLCHACHGRARREQRLGYSNTIGVDGRPTDPNHPANRGTTISANEFPLFRRHESQPKYDLYDPGGISENADD
jgi:5-methylcytosine-specific restriction protein A